MAIDFPNSPTLNDTYTVGSVTWKYDGEKWAIASSGIAGPTGPTGPSGPSGPSGVGAPLTSSATAPVSPSAGELWFDTNSGATYIYYNSAWVELGGGTMSPYQCTSTTRPVAPWTGQTIYETDTKRLAIYNGSSWVAFSNPIETISALPSSPIDGQIIDYVADSTNGIVWRFRYRSASSSSYKWEFIGGPSRYSYVGPLDYYATRQTTTLTTFGDLATVGPSFTTPFAGDWDCALGVRTDTTNTSSCVRVWATGESTSMTWNLGDSVFYHGSQQGCQHYAVVRKTGIASGSTIKLQYCVSNGGTTAYFWDRKLYVTPVRIG